MLLSMLAGALTGLLTGAGIGGGSLLLLYMTVFQKVPQLEAQGINLLYFLAATPLSLYFHIRAHRVETKGAAIAALCGAATCLAGCWAAGAIDAAWLQKGLGAVLLFIGCKELLAKEKPTANGNTAA